MNKILIAVAVASFAAVAHAQEAPVAYDADGNATSNSRIGAQVDPMMSVDGMAVDTMSTQSIRQTNEWPLSVEGDAPAEGNYGPTVTESDLRR